MPWLCRPRVVIFLLSGYAWVWAALTQFSLFSVNKCAIVSSGPVFVTTVITCVDFVQRECENMSHPRSNNASSLTDSMLISSTHVYFCSCAVNDQHIIPLWARHHQNTVLASGRRRSGAFMAMLNVRSKAHFYYMCCFLIIMFHLLFYVLAQPIRRWAAIFMSLNTGQQQKLVCLCVNYRSERKNNYSFGSCNFVNLT